MERNLDIYNKHEDCNIKAKMFYRDGINKISFFVFCHGFCSGKESDSIKIVANKLLEYGITSISFDFPGHMDSTQGTDKLNVDVCISYINTIIDYLKEEYGGNIKISFYAISFGAYILLNKLINDNSIYEHIVLRSPAINMREILIASLLKEPVDKFKSNRFAKAGFNGKLIVPYSFYEDLIKHNLYKYYHEKRQILVFQGELDDTAPISDTEKFISDKPEIELIKMENMKHHMNAEEIDNITDIMIKKFLLLQV